MALRLIAAAMMLLAAGEVAATGAPTPSPEYQAALDAILAPEGESKVRAAVELRQRAGLDEIRAKIAVRRDLAKLYAQRQLWANASAQALVAVALAEILGDPELHVNTLVEYARYLEESNDAQSVFAILAKITQIVAALNRPASLTEPLLLQAELYYEIQQHKEKDQTYERLLALPGVNVFRVELHRARHTRADDIPFYADRWGKVLALARAANRQDVMAEAHDALGLAATMRQQHAEAVAHFAAADAAGPPPDRAIGVWMRIIESNTLVDQRPAARAAIEKVFLLTDAEKDPGRASALHEARGELLGRDGDFAAAFRDLQRANELRRRRDATRQSFPMVRLAQNPSSSEKATATSLATVGHALREAELARTRLLQHQTAARKALSEAELDRTQLLQRQTAGVATVAVLLAALLGLGYAYKRRSAAALASARANAELRADRTHWQMLRYQLNPHFLFNALSSLGGLVVTDPRAAGRVIDRLSEFCQLALQGSNNELRALESELRVIRAYLDVEQAGAGDTLTVRLDAAPAVLPCLVPPLLLQPLVENALKYGGQTSEDHLEVSISARRSPDGANLELEVANTGRWVESSGESRPRAAVGLANVRERLARFGGDSAALTFTHDGHWVRAQLRLPAREAPPAPPAP